MDHIYEAYKNTKKIDESGNDWGSSDQHAMNQSIHKDLGSPKKFISPFDKKLRSAVEDAVDFYWDDWVEYSRDKSSLIDKAVRMYLRAYFPKMMDDLSKLFGVR